MRGIPVKCIMISVPHGHPDSPQLPSSGKARFVLKILTLKNLQPLAFLALPPPQEFLLLNVLMLLPCTHLTPPPLPQEFLLLNVSVLLSDVDILTLKNPFEHLYRDEDVEALSDGFDKQTAYGEGGDPCSGSGRETAAQSW